MDSIRKEIEAEIRRARLDKGRLYDLILKIVDSGAIGGGAGSPGPAGPQGPEGPQGPQGTAGVCKCIKEEKPAPKEEKPVPKEEKPTAKPSAKKVITKKKTVVSA